MCLSLTEREKERQTLEKEYGTYLTESSAEAKHEKKFVKWNNRLRGGEICD